MCICLERASQHLRIRNCPLLFSWIKFHIILSWRVPAWTITSNFSFHFSTRRRLIQRKEIKKDMLKLRGRSEQQACYCKDQSYFRFLLKKSKQSGLFKSEKKFDQKKCNPKMSALGFSRSYLIWTVNYLCGREQFVQIDDRIWKSSSFGFGVPQGAIMGSLIFYIYVADLQGKIDCACHQYADEQLFII